MKLFQYAILYQPSDKEKREGREPEIVCEPTHILARDQNHAMLKAFGQIPDKYKDCLDRIEVAVRPF
jgi:hypothetical protein